MATSQPPHLKVLEGLSPEQRIRRLQLEDAEHDEEHVDAERSSAAAARLKTNTQEENYSRWKKTCVTSKHAKVSINLPADR